MIPEIAKRYARALYEISKEQNSTELILAELTIINNAVLSDDSIQSFIKSPVLSSELKTRVIQTALSKKISNDLLNFLHLLSEKKRLYLLGDIIQAFKLIVDDMKGITRGLVRSSLQLDPEEKKQIEEIVKKVAKKNVILNFIEDQSLLGGMIAQVGGWTFDDSIDLHLTRMSEELNRRSH